MPDREGSRIDRSASVARVFAAHDQGASVRASADNRPDPARLNLVAERRINRDTGRLVGGADVHRFRTTQPAMQSGKRGIQIAARRHAQLDLTAVALRAGMQAQWPTQTKRHGLQERCDVRPVSISASTAGAPAACPLACRFRLGCDTRSSNGRVACAS